MPLRLFSGVAYPAHRPGKANGPSLRRRGVLLPTCPCGTSHPTETRAASPIPWRHPQPARARRPAPPVPRSAMPPAPLRRCTAAPEVRTAADQLERAVLRLAVRRKLGQRVPDGPGESPSRCWARTPRSRSAQPCGGCVAPVAASSRVNPKKRSTLARCSTGDAPPTTPCHLHASAR